MAAVATPEKRQKRDRHLQGVPIIAAGSVVRTQQQQGSRMQLGGEAILRKRRMWWGVAA